MCDLRTAETIAKYHDEHAGYGGASFEFHARSATFIRSSAAEVLRLRAFVADFCDVAEMAATAHETGGMRVPYHGDFCSAAPSVRRDLAAWAKRGREVMGAKP